MDREHCIRWVMAAVAAGGRPCSSAQARRVLRDMCGIDADAAYVIRDGPVRPVYKNDWSYYIPYRYRGLDMEAAAGRWVDDIRKEESDCREMMR